MTKLQIYEKALKDITAIRIQYPHTHEYFQLVNNENLRIAKLIAASALIEADFKKNSEGDLLETKIKSDSFLQFFKMLRQRIKLKRHT
jgi:type IV secretory pathway VirB6-like protein